MNKAIIILILTVSFLSLRSVGREETPTDKAISDQDRQYVVTNYPARLWFYADDVFVIYDNKDQKFFSIRCGKKYLEQSMDNINAAAKQDYEAGKINEHAFKLINAISSQIRSGGVERWKHYDKYKYLMEPGQTRKIGQDRMKEIVIAGQKDWNKYSKASLAKVEDDIQELERRLLTK